MTSVQLASTWQCHRLTHIMTLTEPDLAGVLRRRNSSCRAGCCVAVACFCRFLHFLACFCCSFAHFCPFTTTDYAACDLNKIPMIATCILRPKSVQRSSSKLQCLLLQIEAVAGFSKPMQTLGTVSPNAASKRITN